MWRASFPADQLPSGKQTLTYEHFLKQFIPQEICDIQGTRSRLTDCMLLPWKRSPRKKKIWITFVFSPQSSSSRLLCGSDLLFLQHLLSSLPSPKHSQSKGSLVRRNKTNCSHSSWPVWSLEMLQRGSACRQGCLALGGELSPTWPNSFCFPWYGDSQQ